MVSSKKSRSSTSNATSTPVITISDSDSDSDTDFSISPPSSPPISRTQRQGTLAASAVTTSTPATTTVPAATPFPSLPIVHPIPATSVPTISRIPFKWTPDPRLGAPIMTPECPSPPDWEAGIVDTTKGLAPFELTQVSMNTSEYRALSDMLGWKMAGIVNRITRVRNPHLWQQFKQARVEVLSSKSGNVDLLKGLNINEVQVGLQAHATQAHSAKHSTGLPEYLDNVALLFHCTKSDLTKVLSEGLDERLSNQGYLGRGIYFADDPGKSMQYDGNNSIMIFAVLLGDCVCVDTFTTPQKNSLRREPRKMLREMRTENDYSFDSVFGRPQDTNEYVIYDKRRCCPMYVVEYDAPLIPIQFSVNSDAEDLFSRAQKQVPPFVWLLGEPGRECGIAPPAGWPFYAQRIFGLMKSSRPLSSSTHSINIQDYPQFTKSQLEMVNSIAQMGFPGYTSMASVIPVLEKFNFKRSLALREIILSGQGSSSLGDDDNSTGGSTVSPCQFDVQKKKLCLDNSKTMDHVKDVIDAVAKGQEYSPLFLNAPTPPQSEISTENMGNTKTTEPDPGLYPQVFECIICCNSYDSHKDLFQSLPCNHWFCSNCIREITTTGCTMEGIEHTCIRCPSCNTYHGIPIGDCPTGIMSTEILSSDCEGYTGEGTILIRYDVLGAKGMTRIAYLPNSSEGRETLTLLKKAWDHRLIFRFGTSVTTGQENVLVWNIHHRTRQGGGAVYHGYPDPGYFERVRGELYQLGIK